MDLLPVSRKRCLWSLTITMSVSDVKRFHQISRIRRNLLQHRRNIDQNPTILVYLDDLYRRWMGIVSILRHDQAIWRQWDNDMQLWILRHLKGISSTALRCAINFHSVPHRSETLECYNYGAPGCMQLSVSFFSVINAMIMKHLFYGFLTWSRNEKTGGQTSLFVWSSWMQYSTAT